MIKILIADDSNSKLIEIQEKVLNILNISPSNVTVVPDIISAKRELRDQQFDLFIVDIQLPLRFQEKPKSQGGLELIKDLQDSTRYKLPLNIIGLTEFEDSLQSVFSDFDSHLYSLVKFNRTSDEWVQQLKNQLNHIIRANINIKDSTINYNYDIAIVCALEDVELKSLLNLPVDWEEINYPFDNSRYFTGIIKVGDKEIKIVVSASGQMGMVPASVLTMKIISHFRPKYLAMSGIMAGVKEEVNIGDIIVFDSSWDYGNGKISSDQELEFKFSPDPLPIRLDPDIRSIVNRLCSNDALIQQIKSRWPANKPEVSLKAHIGAVATGASVLAHEKFLKEIIKHQRKLLGVEMEAYGVLYAAIHTTRPRPRTFIVKSVCDFADEEKNDIYQSYAAYTSAMFIYNLVISYLDFD